RRRHTRSKRDWSSDVCSSDLELSNTGRATVTDVNRNVAANFNNNYQDQGMHRYGQQFLYSTLLVKQISTSIKLVGNQAFFNEAEIGRASCRDREDRMVVDSSM